MLPAQRAEVQSQVELVAAVRHRAGRTSLATRSKTFPMPGRSRGQRRARGAQAPAQLQAFVVGGDVTRRGRCGVSAGWAATASVSSRASSRRSIGHSRARRACPPRARAPRRRAGRAHAQLASLAAAVRSCDPRRPWRGSRSKSSAPRSRRESSGAELERLGERRISGRPRPSPGLSGRGTMPRPSSATTTVRRRSSIEARERHRALALGVGVHDDVGAGLGDGQLDVREDRRRRRATSPARHGMPHDRDVLGARGRSARGRATSRCTRCATAVPGHAGLGC